MPKSSAEASSGPARRPDVAKEVACPPVLIFGASTRAAAYSAIRGGLRPICGDFFADADLRRFAELLPFPNYPHGLAQAAEQAPPAPWIYTGGLENHPREISSLRARRPLWGNGPTVLDVLRSPFSVSALLSEADLPHLPVCSKHAAPAVDGKWMLKPLRGSAGRGIAVWEQAAANSPTLAEGHYFQRRKAGITISACYLGLPQRVCLLGVAQQLIGLPELRAGPFGYCGSLAPLPVPEDCLEKLERIGEVLRIASGARGLFGCDFQFDGTTPWLTEVNPRYTASVELFEHLYQVSLLNWHRWACLAGSVGGALGQCEDDLARQIKSKFLQSGGKSAGKVVLYAEQDIRAPPLDHLIPATVAFESIPAYADIPVSGTLIRKGEPICTLLGSGPDSSSCLRGLLQRALDFQRELSHTAALIGFS